MGLYPIPSHGLSSENCNKLGVFPSFFSTNFGQTQKLHGVSFNKLINPPLFLMANSVTPRVCYIVKSPFLMDTSQIYDLSVFLLRMIMDMLTNAQETMHTSAESLQSFTRSERGKWWIWGGKPVKISSKLNDSRHEFSMVNLGIIYWIIYLIIQYPMIIQFTIESAHCL